MVLMSHHNKGNGEENLKDSKDGDENRKNRGSSRDLPSPVSGDPSKATVYSYMRSSIPLYISTYVGHHTYAAGIFV